MKYSRYQLVALLCLILGLTTVVYFGIYRNYSVKYQLIPTSSATTNINMSVNPGSISESIEHDLSSLAEIRLSSVDVSLASPSGEDSTGQLRTIVRDHRGTSIGWTQTLSCTDFSDGTNTISVDHLTITPNLITPIGTSDITNIVLGGSHTFVDPLDVMPLATAPVGSGTGRFRITNDILLHIDKNTVPSSYTSTMTVTIS